MADQTIQKPKTKGILNTILDLYRESVKRVPILRYSWVLVSTICILSLAAYFKLQTVDVFVYALAVLIISFLSFVFSQFLKTKDITIRISLYIFTYGIIITMTALVISFGSFVIFKQPEFYKRFFKETNDAQSNPTVTNPIDDKGRNNNQSLSIDGLIVNESKNEYVIEAKIYNPLSRDLLLRNFKVDKQLYRDVDCYLLGIPYYIISNKVSLTSADISGISFRTNIRNNDKNLKNTYVLASGFYKSGCRSTKLEINFDMLMELSKNSYSTLFISIPKVFNIKEDKTISFRGDNSFKHDKNFEIKHLLPDSDYVSSYGGNAYDSLQFTLSNSDTSIFYKLGVGKSNVPINDY